VFFFFFYIGSAERRGEKEKKTLGAVIRVNGKITTRSNDGQVK